MFLTEIRIVHFSLCSIFITILLFDGDILEIDKKSAVFFNI